MFEKPYFLLLLLLPMIFIFYKYHRYYLRHAYVKSLTQSRPTKQYIYFQFICTSIGWLLLVLSAADFVWGTDVIIKKQPIHKYVLINDGSGSMVEINKIRGLGKRLASVHKGNEALLDMLDKRNDGSRDLVGAIVFSTDAFVVSYMVDEPSFVNKKLATIDYRLQPLNSGTVLDRALWSGINMILSNEKDPDDDLKMLYLLMFGMGHDYKRDSVETVIEKYRSIAEHSCIIIFTDGEFDSPGGFRGRMSVYKQLHLCKDLGIKVYVISVESVDQYVQMYIKDTGGFYIIFRDFDESKFRQAYESIVESQAKEEIAIEERVVKSFASSLALIAFVFLITGLFFRLTFDRNFTEV